jgi:16S rRNA C1402 (ribose-2'-O) methylase RsmI
VKGEITLVIGPADEAKATGDAAASAAAITEVERLKANGLDQMQAIKQVAKQMGLPKREVYRLAVAQDSNPPDKHRDSDRSGR